MLGAREASEVIGEEELGVRVVCVSQRLGFSGVRGKWKWHLKTRSNFTQTQTLLWDTLVESGDQGATPTLGAQSVRECLGGSGSVA